MSPMFPVEETATATILVVDDEDWNRMLVESVLEDSGYRIVTAASGAQALDLVAGDPPDAILLDIMMPEVDGYEVCRRLKSSRRTFFIPVVMLTALTDVASKARGLEVGADDFLNKPFNRIELATRLKSLLRIRALRSQLDTTESVIYSMVTAMESKDPSTKDHSLRVAALVSEVVKTLRLTGPDLESMIWAALLHDIGKLGVPDEVLETGPDQRSLDAHRLFQLHALYGERILSSLPSLRQALPIIRHHHERLDGSGYPDGLSGHDFTPPIQVVAAANAYENYRVESAAATPDTWAAQLRAEAAAGKFHGGLVEGIIQAEKQLPEMLPELVDLLPVPEQTVGGKIFVADDSAPGREILHELLSGAGYDVRTFADGDRLLSALFEAAPDLVMVDVNMPRVGGEEVCRRLRSDPGYAYLPILLLTANLEATSKERALVSGADDLLSVPVDRVELLARVRSLLRLSAYHGDLEQGESVVLALSGMLEAKDPAANGHSARVAELAEGLARALDLPPEVTSSMRTAGLLHDIGKVAIPEHILHKSALTEDEAKILRTHPVRSYEICKDLRSVRHALPAIRHHHEHADGSGYPDELIGDAIPVGTRVLALANAFDGLTIRHGLTPREAIERLGRETAEGLWAPEVYRALEQLMAEDEGPGSSGPRSATDSR